MPRVSRLPWALTTRSTSSDGALDSTYAYAGRANLVGNGVKFSPRDGQVRVEVELGSSGPEIRVIDQGRGIAPEFHARIFEKFGMANGNGSSQFRSSGLGLTFCKLAVEAHCGRIEVESEVGQGCSFRVVLPGY